MSDTSTNVDSLYQQIILDHYKNPHGRGLREPFDAEVHHVNPTCGDEITLRLHCDGETVADVSYDAEGCSISQAAASTMYDLVTDTQLNDALILFEEFSTLVHGRGKVEPNENRLNDAVAFGGVAQFPARVKCALLPWMAFKDAAARTATKEGDEK